MLDAAAPPVPEGMDPTAWLAAVADVRGYCAWHLAPVVTETVTVDGSGGAVQLLPTLHLTGLTSITNDGVLVEEPQWSEMGAVRGPRYWTSKYRGVVAEITHGYAEFPLEVLAVLRSMAKDGLTLTGKPRKFTSGPHSVELSDPSPLHLAVLERYRVKASV